MASIVETAWNATGLDASLIRGWKASVKVLGEDAKAHAPNHKSGASTKITSDTTGFIKPTGFGTIFEVGRQGGYPIYAGGIQGVRRVGRQGNSRIGLGRKSLQSSGKYGTGARALIVTSGGYAGQFYSHVTGGKLEADPYIKPAASRWTAGGCQATMTAYMTAAGFRRR